MKLKSNEDFNIVTISPSESYVAFGAQNNIVSVFDIRKDLKPVHELRHEKQAVSHQVTFEISKNF